MCLQNETLGPCVEAWQYMTSEHSLSGDISNVTATDSVMSADDW